MASPWSGTQPIERLPELLGDAKQWPDYGDILFAGFFQWALRDKEHEPTLNTRELRTVRVVFSKQWIEVFVTKDRKKEVTDFLVPRKQQFATHGDEGLVLLRADHAELYIKFR